MKRSQTLTRRLTAIDGLNDQSDFHSEETQQLFIQYASSPSVSHSNAAITTRPTTKKPMITYVSVGTKVNTMWGCFSEGLQLHRQRFLIQEIHSAPYVKRQYVEFQESECCLLQDCSFLNTAYSVAKRRKMITMKGRRSQFFVQLQLNGQAYNIIDFPGWHCGR